ncbi:alpha/beta hydrolase family esterase [Cryptosporangium sp. NPDC048952]|uniref:alpha/beta hydrolase family esterase n=1 Tax=Cryptosporangium sp. NPDC048952 TaxID=3363961 RepID=UPI003723EBC7
MTSIDVAGRTRTYTAVTPEDGDFKRVLLVFHGSKQNGAAFRRFSGNAFDRLSDTAVVYLDGYRKNWNDARAASAFPARAENIDDVAFAERVADRVADGRPVYAAGFSNGGAMVIRLLHERPDLLAGGAVISAQQPAPDNFLLPDAPVVAKPVLLFHGTKDRIVPYGGGEMARWAQFAFKVGGAMLSAPETAAYFAQRNGITAPPLTVDLPHRGGRTTVSRTDYRQDGRAPVTLYTVHGGGHTVPGEKPSPALMGRTGSDVHAAEAIEELF